MSVNLYALIERRPGHPRLEQPFYIGIGTAKRPYKHLAQSRSKAGHRNLRLHEILVSHHALSIIPAVEIIGVFPDKTAAGEAEKDAIRRYGRIGIETDGILCNLAVGGQGPDAELMRLPEMRKRNSEAQKRRTPESRANLIAAGRANARNETINANRSKASTESNARSWADPEVRARRIAAMKGKKKTLSPEALAARRANAQGGKTAEARAKRSKASLERWQDPDFKDKRRRNQSAAWQDPEKRANMLAGRAQGIAKSWKDPEVRARRIAAIKAAAAAKRDDIAVHEPISLD